MLTKNQVDELNKLFAEELLEAQNHIAEEDNKINLSPSNDTRIVSPNKNETNHETSINGDEGRVMKIALIGDSIFDNEAYTGKADCVFAKTTELLPNHEIVNLAVDGATINDLINSLGEVKDSYENLWDYAFVSIGGNDLINHQEELMSINDLKRNTLIKGISDNVLMVIEQLKKKFNNVIFYKPYIPYFDDSFSDNFISLAHKSIKYYGSCFFDAQEQGLLALNLNKFLYRPEDFTNVIEPSTIGSIKIAQTIKKIVENEFSFRGEYLRDVKEYKAFSTGRRIYPHSFEEVEHMLSKMK